MYMYLYEGICYMYMYLYEEHMYLYEEHMIHVHACMYMYEGIL